MAKISVTRPHNLGADAVKEALAPFEDDIAKYGLKPKWSGHKAELKGLGASGKILIEDSAVTVEIKLGMLAASAGIKADGSRSIHHQAPRKSLKCRTTELISIAILIA